MNYGNERWSRRRLELAGGARSEDGPGNPHTLQKQNISLHQM